MTLKLKYEMPNKNHKNKKWASLTNAWAHRVTKLRCNAKESLFKLITHESTKKLIS